MHSKVITSIATRRKCLLLEAAPRTHGVAFDPVLVALHRGVRHCWERVRKSALRARPPAAAPTDQHRSERSRRTRCNDTSGWTPRASTFSLAGRRGGETRFDTRRDSSGVTWALGNGGSGGNRTHDQWIKSPVLYRLSYRPHAREAVRRGGPDGARIIQVFGQR